MCKPLLYITSAMENFSLLVGKDFIINRQLKTALTKHSFNFANVLQHHSYFIGVKPMIQNISLQRNMSPEMSKNFLLIWISHNHPSIRKLILKLLSFLLTTLKSHRPNVVTIMLCYAMLGEIEIKPHGFRSSWRLMSSRQCFIIYKPIGRTHVCANDTLRFKAIDFEFTRKRSLIRISVHHYRSLEWIK